MVKKAKEKKLKEALAASEKVAEPKKEEKNEKKAEAKPKKAEKTRLKPATKKSKRYIEIKNLIEKGKIYPAEQAIELAKKTANTKFNGSVEVHVRLGIGVSKSDQAVRGTVTLPHGSGKIVKIAAFVNEAKEKEAKEAGADIVGGQEMIDRIKQTSKINFDVAVTTPDMMPKLAIIAKILGPKGLMPSPKNETITTNLKKTIEELKKGKANFKSDDTGNIHNIIGKTSFETKQSTENYNALIGAIKKAKPASAKGIFIKSISINATMGPGIKVAI